MSFNNPLFNNMNNMCAMYNMNNMNNWNNMSNWNNMNNLNNINNMNNMNSMYNIIWLNNFIGMISNINKNDLKNYEEIIKKIDAIIQQKESEIYYLNQSKMSIMNLMNNININKSIPKDEEQNQNDNYLILKFIKKNSNKIESKIDVQCLRDQEIQKAINMFCCKCVVDKNNFVFYHNKKQINMDKPVTIGELGINNNDEIIVIDKEDLNKNKKFELFDEVKSSDDDNSSEEKKDIEINNKNNSIKEGKINLFFVTPGNEKTFMVLDYNESVGNAFKQYFKKIGLNPNNAKEIVFLYNGNKVKSSDYNRIIGEYFENNHPTITVLDVHNIQGA